MPKVKHFKNLTSYKKAMAYEHIHHLETTGPHPEVLIAGHHHKVKHKR